MRECNLKQQCVGGGMGKNEFQISKCEFIADFVE